MTTRFPTERIIHGDQGGGFKNCPSNCPCRRKGKVADHAKRAADALVWAEGEFVAMVAKAREKFRDQKRAMTKEEALEDFVSEVGCAAAYESMMDMIPNDEAVQRINSAMELARVTGDLPSMSADTAAPDSARSTQ